MLNTETNRCERILYLMRDLSGHLAPGEDALRSGYLDPAQLEIACEHARGDTAQPERSDTASGSCKEDEHGQIPAAPVQNYFIAARRRCQHVTLARGRRRGAITPEDFRVGDRLLPARGGLAGLHNDVVPPGGKHSPRRRAQLA